MATPNKHQYPSHEIPQASSRNRGTGRRSSVRYPAVLDSTIIVSQGRSINCTMRNFCMGGMLLSYSQYQFDGQPIFMAENEIVTVKCNVPVSGGDKSVEFRARVARTVQDGLGIAFINPDQGSLQLMQQFALQYSLEAVKKQAHKIEEIKKSSHQGNVIGRRNVDVIAGCERIVLETMDSLLEQIGAKLINQLIDMSREVTEPEKQTEYFGASEILRTNNKQFFDAIRSNFKERLQESVDSVLSRNQIQAKESEDLSLDNLSLIGDEDLDAWLAVSEITNKVEEKNKEYLATLEERLSVVFDLHINNINNPYGPAIFTESFQVGLGLYKFKEDVNVVCYSVLKEILIPLSSDLYEKLNKILIDYGILPKLKYRPIGHSASENNRHVESNTSQVPVAESMHWDQVDSNEQSTEKDHKISDTDGNDDIHSKSTHDKESRTQKRPIIHESSSDLYQLVHNLRELRREYTQQQGYSPPAIQGGDPSAPLSAGDQGNGREMYSTSDLIAAVADLQVDSQFSQQGESQVSPVISRILDVLNVRYRDHGGKGINPRDNNVMEVTGGLLTALQNDPLVAGDVKPWLKQLELPVLKLALQDPTLFFDQSHVARQVVNSIAQLEFYKQEGGNAKHSSISAAIEELLEKIATERSDGVEIFTEIQSKLDKLIKIQNKAYADNVKDVVKACDENSPIPEIYNYETIGGDDISDHEMNKWMMFAQRLRVGDDVLFASMESKSQRLRVAWINGERTIYVFVNLRGIKEKVLMVADVARMIRLGIIEPQGDATDPAMDRAQYSIMQDLYKQVVHESTHDSLTGLINRREFGRRLKEAVTDAMQFDKRHVLILIDIDQFSAINSSCGYGGGDKLLIDIVDILKQGLEGKGEIARIGADVFAVLFNDCSLDDALALTERHIEEVANYKLSWEDHQYSVSLSVGIVPISARSGSIDELMQAAESSCAIAKDAGGNRLQVFHAGYSRVSHQGEIKKWAAKIDKIVEENGLVIRCQRIEPVDGESQLRPHYEILLGVKDDQGNVGSPVEFIKGAELSRKMSTIDRYVITKALSWMNDNCEIFENIGGFTINLSGESLNEDGFVDFILDQLKTISVPYDKICFEVTETVGITDLSNTTLGIDRIKDAGCRFALDDFGSGMSSYGYLKTLPVDVIKIDGAFVKELVADSSDYAVVKSITEIAHFMNKRVVAEFVENKDILDLLREIGVDYAQGYMIDKPGSLDRLVDLHITNGEQA